MLLAKAALTAFIKVWAMAWAMIGGTALPICLSAGFMVPAKMNPSGKLWSLAPSRTEIVRAWALS